MSLIAVLLVERGGGQIPLCRARDAAVIQRVASSALVEARGELRATRDPLMSALCQQEIERLERAYETLGLTAEEVSN